MFCRRRTFKCYLVYVSFKLKQQRKQMRKKQHKTQCSLCKFYSTMNKNKHEKQDRVLRNLKTAVASKKQNISHAG